MMSDRLFFFLWRVIWKNKQIRFSFGVLLCLLVYMYL